MGDIGSPPPHVCLLMRSVSSCVQLVYGQLDAHKASLQRITESLQMKYKDNDTLVPLEIESQLQEVTNSLGQIESKVCHVGGSEAP